MVTTPHGQPDNKNQTAITTGPKPSHQSGLPLSCNFCKDPVGVSAKVFAEAPTRLLRKTKAKAQSGLPLSYNFCRNAIGVSAKVFRRSPRQKHCKDHRAIAMVTAPSEQPKTAKLYKNNTQIKTITP